MKKRLLLGGIILILVFMGISGCIDLGPEVTDYFEEEYGTTENTHVKIININGQIEIYNWDNDTILLNAIKRTRHGRDEFDKIEIIATENDDILEIEAKYLDSKDVHVSIDMNIKIPHNVIVDSATTSNGDVQIYGTKGNTTASSSNGRIIIQNVDGYVKARTSNGRIEIQGTTGIRELETSNGKIYAEIFTIQDNLDIRTSNGRIIVYINPLLNTNISMETSNGQISIRGLSLNLTISEDKYKLGKLGEGGNLIFIQTTNGDIDIHKLDI
jgi:DUF4097 and DUF4098 domain-containing protein YvlB